MSSRRDKPQHCPRCGSQSLAEIDYGFPAGTEKLREDIEQGSVVLGGCVVTDDDPTKSCLACGIVIWPDGRTLSEAVWSGGPNYAAPEDMEPTMSVEWEQYKDRYAAERPETYEAYVDVWNRIPAARHEFTGWAVFTQAANTEPKQKKHNPERVQVAERIMRQGGYEIGPPTKRNARRWVKRQ
jgi:hypothetical protein